MTLKVLHMATQQTGGAGIAALRLHRALLLQGVESSFLSLLGEKIAAEKIHVLPKHYPRFWQRALNRVGLPSTQAARWARIKQQHDLPAMALSGLRSDIRVSDDQLVQQADIIHFHWVTGMFDWPDFLKHLDKPVVWTMHDMNPFMGVFHYQNDLDNSNDSAMRYEELIVAQKIELFKNRKSLVCVAPSRWLSEHCRRSRVLGGFEQRVIRNPIDTDTFKPADGMFSREVFGLPKEKRLLLMVAERVEDYRKGGDILADAMSKFKSHGDWELVVVGAGQFRTESLNVHWIGSIHDQRLLALLYSAVDLCVVASREDNLPNVVVESLCCGTPVVATPAGGIPEIVEHQVDGMIADEIKAESLSKALTEAVNMNFDKQAIRARAVEKFDQATVATQYQEVYRLLT